MKKLIVCVLSIMAVIPVFAESVCAKDSIVTVVLDPSIPPSDYTYNTAAGVWKATASYGTITGISTCIADAPQGGMGSVYNSNGEHVEAVGNQATGSKCWCKMTHPMESLWAFYTDFGSAASCASNCTNRCGYRVQDGEALRVGLFGSVAQ